MQRRDVLVAAGIVLVGCGEGKDDSRGVGSGLASCPGGEDTPDQINVNIYNETEGNNATGQTATAPWVSNVRAQQAAKATHLIDTDTFPRYEEDDLHFTGAGQHAHGAALATLLLSLV